MSVHNERLRACTYTHMHAHVYAVYTNTYTYSASSKRTSPNNLVHSAMLANVVEDVTDLNHVREIGYPD
jgi:hypothetical protein